MINLCIKRLFQRIQRQLLNSICDKMAGLNVEGDLTQISDRQLEYIKTVIEKKGYKNNKVVIEAVGKAGDNYVANVKRITVEDGKRPFKMVAKIAPGLEIMRKSANTEALFRNEHIMYVKVLPKFTQLEISADIPPQERLRYAHCYGSFQEAPNEVILLEDLNEHNFIMLDRFKSIGNDCVKSVLKNFASLHSASYALKFKEPEVYEEFKNSLFDMWATFEGQPEVIMYFKQVEASACSVVESDVYKKAIDGALTNSMKDFFTLSTYEKNSKHGIIQQGDAWTNNIMFKFDGETLLESIMIDYQLSKPANPVLDILYMIFNCTHYEDRKEHFYEWIDYYHFELDKALWNYGLKANLIFPRDQLDADLKRYGKVSFGLSVLLSGVLTMKSEDASNMRDAMEKSDLQEVMKEADSALRNPETLALFKKRLEGLVESYHEFGLL